MIICSGVMTYPSTIRSFNNSNGREVEIGKVRHLSIPYVLGSTIAGRSMLSFNRDVPSSNIKDYNVSSLGR